MKHCLHNSVSGHAPVTRLPCATGCGARPGPIRGVPKPQGCPHTRHATALDATSTPFFVLDRRRLMTGLALTVLPSLTLSHSPQPAHAQPTTWTSELPSTLSTKEYSIIINEARPPCWKRTAQLIQATDFTALAQSLDVPPFSDLRQAAFYIPWAILQQNDFVTAVDSRKGFNDFESHVLDLQRASLSAAQGQTEPSTVQQAFILMSASLDSFLATIPASYLTPKA